jgi:hypothetical protein
MDRRVFQADAIEGLGMLDAGSVALVLSDLPSGETKAEFDEAPDLTALFCATWRALKPDGVVVFMASSLRFAARCMTAGGAAYRYDLVWEKSMATGVLNAKHRPLRAHEFVLVFQRERGCFTPQMDQGAPPIRTWDRRSGSGENYDRPSGVTSSRSGATDRFPRSVLHFGSLGTTSPDRIHPQQKPVDLLRWLVRSYSRPGDLVVDPFAGSASTYAACIAEGRHCIAFDRSPRFATVAR